MQFPDTPDIPEEVMQAVEEIINMFDEVVLSQEETIRRAVNERLVPLGWSMSLQVGLEIWINKLGSEKGPKLIAPPGEPGDTIEADPDFDKKFMKEMHISIDEGDEEDTNEPLDLLEKVRREVINLASNLKVETRPSFVGYINRGHVFKRTGISFKLPLRHENNTEWHNAVNNTFGNTDDVDILKDIISLLKSISKV
ncbi:MAG: hypothetical protein COV29_04575 [Candidatus Yanofskybacteria bacterium CG10_big_fil_rev_8_21_14_0_10_36_16]|uniref:Uncharacterized protein n=1 Tax=Candidatus Yanofskybacteria bacterium CG10_big_fil_rev_8_21_14_0_10_36_16 TaxID=1975096 RepID=A0A2J0Q6I4_9BACT|nr:MAG: hypothetical protein COV29_04575 [Candidatus Yanofskybacteria bacterium CG10_big_fil_rev_8_21_14_0_10_36_16]